MDTAPESPAGFTWGVIKWVTYLVTHCLYRLRRRVNDLVSRLWQLPRAAARVSRGAGTGSGG
jgi:hypothetical protein